MGQQYSITFTNNSQMMGTGCVFQQDNNIQGYDVFPLAWMTRICAPNMRASFSWTLDYCFVWAETGRLMPGVVFNSSQILQADLNNQNQVTFDYRNGTYTFSNLHQGGQSGTLTIQEASGIPMSGSASIGIGMSGTATFAAQAMPNMNQQFRPAPTYWMAFGQFTTGQVLDIHSMGNIVGISFPAGVYSMNVTLNPDNTWTISRQ
ncbi:MAG: hypothetical protein P4L41_07235 [Flavipsychrobacter sp.]|nr:hypothetical protein [Flavipsychrobacter sp.]